MDDSINIYRSQIVANTFHLFIAGAKASLYPFLTLFFRYVGLSATQTGIVVGVGAFLSMASTPFWMTCASKCHRKRCVLMMSIFVIMLSSLMLSLVPPQDQNLEKFCLPVNLKHHKNKQKENDTDIYGSTTDGVTFNLTEGLSPQTVNLTTSLSVVSTTFRTSTTKKIHTVPEVQQSSTTTSRTSTTTVTTSRTSTTTETISVDEDDNFQKLLQTIPEDLLDELGLNKEDLTPEILEGFLKKKMKDLTSHSPVTTETNVGDDDNEQELSESDRKLLVDLGLSPDQIDDLDYKTLLKLLVNSFNGDGSSRKRRNAFSTSMDSINTEFSKLQLRLTKVENASFIIVLSIVIFSSLFSCSIERLADKMWFDFTDGIDMIEKYGAHRSWEYLGWIFVPVLVTIFVDYTECLLPHGIYHFNIHFYVFAALMGFGFIWSFMFPMLHDKKKVHRHTSLWKGLRVLCGDVHGFSYCVCVLILGLASAVIDNFLMWQIQDLGGSEMVLGGAITIGAFMSLIIHIILRWIVYKIGSAGAVILALLALTIRMVVYSFLWSPWVVLAVGFLQGFSHTLLLGTIENYPDFKVNPYVMDRSAKSVVSALYLGIAYTCGSVASGYLYDLIGLSVVYQGLAVVVVAWGLVFTLIHKCVKHSKKVRYARLLQAEEDQLTEDYDSDDDWLQTALKHEK